MLECESRDYDCLSQKVEVMTVGITIVGVTTVGVVHIYGRGYDDCKQKVEIMRMLKCSRGYEDRGCDRHPI